MNSINNTVTGLASSLLLNVGLATLAEKLDPMQHQAGHVADLQHSAGPCISCEVCNFTPEAGQ